MWILFFIRHCQIFLCLNQFLAQFIIQSAAYLYKRVFAFHLILCILNDWWWWTSFHEFIPSTLEFLWNVNFSTIISIGNFFSVDYLSYLLIMGRSTIYFPKCNFFFLLEHARFHFYDVYHLQNRYIISPSVFPFWKLGLTWTQHWNSELKIFSWIIVWNKILVYTCHAGSE